MPAKTRSQSKRPRKVRAIKAIEAGVKAAQDTFAKILAKADPKPKR